MVRKLFPSWRERQAEFAPTRDVRLEIGDQSVLFPIAVAGRIETAAAAGFLGLIGVAVAFGAARCRFGQRAFGCRRKWALFAGFTLGFGRRRVLWLRVGWHRL